MKLFYLFLLSACSFCLTAQPLAQKGSAEILHDIQKLKVLGSVLYLAAHPDDENTRLIAWLANGKMVETSYLSMTRGDGGQNLIGPEIREQLGIIRTQELLAARRIDNGKQFFTRANDFGYSKSPEETFNLWDKEKILADVVWVIRNTRPDVIITRFPATGEGGHGHHTASAILANEAFELAGDPGAFPEQLKYVEPWQPKRLYVNTGRWWNPDMTGDEPGVITVDVGEYDPLLGISYTEMASLSRSQHKSQGFGSTGTRGETIEFLEHKKGKQAENFIFENIDISWGRVGAPAIEEQVQEIIDDYNPLSPSNSLHSLLELREKVEKIENKFWRDRKIKAINDIIKSSLGLYLEASTTDPYLVPSEKVDLSLELVNRSSAPVNLSAVSWPQNIKKDSAFTLPHNQEVKLSHTFTLDENTKYSTPYWLRNEAAIGYYNVPNQQLIGEAENEPELTVKVNLIVMDEPLSFTIPVVFKWNDPVEGELHRPVAIVPAVSMAFSEEIYLFPTRDPKPVRVKVKNYASRFNGDIGLRLPEGWKCSPEKIHIGLEGKLAEEELIFTITPPEGESSISAQIIAEANGNTLNKEVELINYGHIPIQTIVSNAQAEFVKLNVRINGNRIGYIEGAGDAIPATLRELGYSVTVLNEQQISGGLSTYDAIIVGIRALNTNDRIAFIMSDLLKYVQEGGNLILQYNTSHRLQTNNFSPYPLELSRDRVTVEEAPVTVLAPDHIAMNYPNKITSEDFEGWVQERGLYFPDKWDERFTPLFSIHDPGEKETKGSLLIAPYGKGYYVYSGISWFRQLPAGVPGAIRIFANLLSLKGHSSDAK